MSGDNGETGTGASALITCVADLVTNLTAIAMSGEPHWYRGQANWTWALGPKVFRRKTFREAETALIDAFRSEAALAIGGYPADKWGWISFAQHHGLPTRLLDWTDNPLIALYFACEDPKESKSDGSLYAIRPRALNREAGDGDAGHPALLDDEQTDLKNYLPNAGGPRRRPRAVLSPMFFDRIRFQSGAFTVHHPYDRAEANDEFDESNAVDTFLIPADSKTTICSELALLGISDATVFRDLDRIAKGVTGRIEGTTS